MLKKKWIFEVNEITKNPKMPPRRLYISLISVKFGIDGPKAIYEHEKYSHRICSLTYIYKSICARFYFVIFSKRVNLSQKKSYRYDSDGYHIYICNYFTYIKFYAPNLNIKHRLILSWYGSPMIIRTRIWDFCVLTYHSIMNPLQGNHS